jgi:hypothetical protein
MIICFLIKSGEPLRDRLRQSIPALGLLRQQIEDSIDLCLLCFGLFVEALRIQRQCGSESQLGGLILRGLIL